MALPCVVDFLTAARAGDEGPPKQPRSGAWRATDLLDILYLESGGKASPGDLLDILYLESGGKAPPGDLLDILYLESGGKASPGDLRSSGLGS